MFEGHEWLVPILDDLIEHCERHSMRGTAERLTQARSALLSRFETFQQLVPDEQQEQWFGEIVDELARYCHHQGLDDVETRLLQAQEAWHDECQPRHNGNVLTFPAKPGSAQPGDSGTPRR